MSTINWKAITRRTDDPKLAWIERRLDEHNIPHMRSQVASWHAPILLVPEDRATQAGDLIWRIDHVDDQDPRWEQDAPYTVFEHEPINDDL